MAKVQIKSEKLTPFGGIFSIMEQFDSMLSPVIDSTLGQRCSSIFGYQYSEIIRSLMSVYFCGGSCVEDVTSHLMRHLSYHPTLRTCSSDTILRAIKELTQENISYTSDKGKTYDFNTADKLNALLIKALVSTGELNEVETYDVDFDHQFLETEKYDAKPTYKKFLGYRPGVYVIGDMIVYVENSDGNTNVRFYQAETHKRFFALLEANSIRVNRFRADCGSCSKEIVSEIEKHCTHFYIRANRCSSLYDDLFSLRGWKTEEINGIQFELNSILVEKWEGKCYRLVIQRQKRMDGELDLWEGEYTYRSILTNDYDSSTRDIVEFYNKRGGKEFEVGFRPVDGIRQFLGGIKNALQASEAAVPAQYIALGLGRGTPFPVKEECRPYRLDVVPQSLLAVKRHTRPDRVRQLPSVRCTAGHSPTTGRNSRQTGRRWRTRCPLKAATSWKGLLAAFRGFHRQTRS